MRAAPTLSQAQSIPSIARVAQSNGTWIVYEPGDTLPAGLFGAPTDDVLRYASKEDFNNITAWGAVGDGDPAKAASNSIAINRAIDEVFLSGETTVYIPDGHFCTNYPIKVKSGIKLKGNGYTSRIDNIATSGFTKCTVITGNVGDIGNGSLFDEDRYALNAVAAGSNSVTLAGSASDFSVGDIVVLMSYETYLADSRYPLHTNLNRVEGKSGNTLTLRYAVPDEYPTTSGSPTISRLSGTLTGYDGEPLWMATEAEVSNIRLTNVQGLSSGWYALFACGLNNRYENIWADNCSGVIGGNTTGRSLFKNISGAFDLRGVDLSDIQDSNVMSDIDLTRNRANTLLAGAMVGFAVHDGQDVIVERLRGDFGGYGQASMLYVNRGVFRDPRISKAGGSANVGLLLGYGTDLVLDNPTVYGSEREAIYIAGERAKVRGGIVTDSGKSGAFNAVYIKNNINECLIDGLTVGKYGARTVKDRIVQGSIPIYSAESTYEKGAVVYYPASPSVYVRSAEITAPEPWDAAKWIPRAAPANILVQNYFSYY